MFVEEVLPDPSSLCSPPMWIATECNGGSVLTLHITERLLLQPESASKPDQSKSAPSQATLHHSSWPPWASRSLQQRRNSTYSVHIKEVAKPAISHTTHPLHLHVRKTRPRTFALSTSCTSTLTKTLARQDAWFPLISKISSLHHFVAHLLKDSDGIIMPLTHPAPTIIHSSHNHSFLILCFVSAPPWPASSSTPSVAVS